MAKRSEDELRLAEEARTAILKSIKRNAEGSGSEACKQLAEAYDILARNIPAEPS